MSIAVFSWLRVLYRALSALFAGRRTRLGNSISSADDATASRFARHDLPAGWMRRGPPGLKSGGPLYRTNRSR
jgi:hypothetical protein